MNKAQAAHLGGLAVLAKYGPEYMRTLGKKGAKATWTKYSLQPVNLNDFAMVDKATGIQVALISGKHIKHLKERSVAESQ